MKSLLLLGLVMLLPSAQAVTLFVTPDPSHQPPLAARAKAARDVPAPPAQCRHLPAMNDFLRRGDAPADVLFSVRRKRPATTNQQTRKSAMKTHTHHPTFDEIVEENYPLIYRSAAALVAHPARAVVLANRVFMRARELFNHGVSSRRARPLLIKILYLESLSEAVRHPAANARA